MLMTARMTNPVFVLDGAMVAMQALARSGGSRRTRCPDAIWDAAAEHFDEPQLAGLVLDIAQINVLEPAQRRHPPGGGRAEPASGH